MGSKQGVQFSHIVQKYKKIKIMKIEFRNYRNYNGEKCLQALPCINYWYKHLDPEYTNALFIGWLYWGICIHFDK
jgi:hypothetical protein